MSRFSFIKRVEGDKVDVRNAAVASVQGQSASLTNGVAGAVVSDNDASLTQGAAIAVVAGRDIKVKTGASAVMVAGNNLTVDGGGAAYMHSGNARLSNSQIGFLVSGQTELGENNRIVIQTPQALGIGMGIGLALALVAGLVKIATWMKEE